AEFLHDMATLAELQGKLVVVDLHDGMGKLVVQVAMIALAAAIGLGCVPIALSALALAIAANTSFSLAASFGIALWVGVVLAAGFGIPALISLRADLKIFDRSLSEWRRNRQWAKETLKRLAQSPQRTSSSRMPTGRF